MAEIIGAFAQTTIPNPATPFAIGFPAVSPLWFAILLMIAPGGMANIESAAMSVYNAALDVHAAFWRLTRAQLTLIMSAIGLATAYIALIGFNAISSIEAFATIMLVTCTPWMTIMAVGHIMRRGRYRPLDLQAFAGRKGKGIYWFTRGFNIRAFIAWAVATGVGMLFASTTIITGPLTKHVDGIDLSFTSAAVIGAVLYYVLAKVWPEEGVMVSEADAHEEVQVPTGVGIAN
jgi:purine-cytosine permease-like protein